MIEDMQIPAMAAMKMGSCQRPGPMAHTAVSDAYQPRPCGAPGQRQSAGGGGVGKLSSVAVGLSRGAALWPLEQFRSLALGSGERSNHSVFIVLGHVLQW